MKKEIKEGRLYWIKRKLASFRYNRKAKKLEELPEKEIAQNLFIIKGIKDLGKKEFVYLCEIIGANVTTDIFGEYIIDFREVNFSCS